MTKTLLLLVLFFTFNIPSEIYATGKHGKGGGQVGNKAADAMSELTDQEKHCCAECCNGHGMMHKSRAKRGGSTCGTCHTTSHNNYCYQCRAWIYEYKGSGSESDPIDASAYGDVYAKKHGSNIHDSNEAAKPDPCDGAITENTHCSQCTSTGGCTKLDDFLTRKGHHGCTWDDRCTEARRGRK